MSDYRKLRTIYDALDAHNFKQSLKLCDAALKKAADTSMVKALKAVTLERMGRTEEGLKLARDVASALAPPADDHLLSTLNIVFKATGHSAEGAAAYELAFSQEPKNEALGLALFGAWLREREYAKAQQLMMKMCAARNYSAQFCARFGAMLSLPIRTASQVQDLFRRQVHVLGGHLPAAPAAARRAPRPRLGAALVVGGGAGGGGRRRRVEAAATGRSDDAAGVDAGQSDKGVAAAAAPRDPPAPARGERGARAATRARRPPRYG